MPAKKRHVSNNITSDLMHMPVGMRFLAGYVAMLIVFFIVYLLLGIKAPFTFIFGLVVEGPIAVFTLFSLVLISSFLLYGFVARTKWAYYLGLLWFGFGILSSLISLIIIRQESLVVTRNIVMLTSIAVILINVLVLWYIHKEKSYFFSKRVAVKRKASVTDRIFIIIFTSFIVLTLLFALIIGLSFYNENVHAAEQIISEIGNKSFIDSRILCAEKDASQRDLCYLVLSIRERSKSLCYHINSEFYKIACLKAE